MTPLRDVLLSLGLVPKDLDEAVDESREVVRAVEKWSGLGSKALVHVAKHSPEGSKRALVAFLGAGLADSVRKGAAGMLGRK